jgi:hypothetical protein
MFAYRKRLAACGLAISVAIIANVQARAQLAESDFSVDVDGWLVSGDVTSAVPAYVATGGNPSGYINATDLTVGGIWFWEAPAKFLGDKSGAYGFPLTYELRMRGSGPLFNYSDVILDGGGLSLHLVRTPPVPGNIAWTSYSALLSEAEDWRIGSAAGAAATQSQVQAVLASLTRLRIRGEFISGSDNGDIDNVVLNGVPEPDSLVVALFSLTLLFKRQRVYGR